jgi:hypothetical protein
MAREWTDEEIRALIADSRKIVEEDREKAAYATLHEKYGAKPDPKDPKDPKGPPPRQDEPPPDDKPKRKPLWPVGNAGEE